MPAARTKKSFRLTGFLFACLVLSQEARTANAEENRRVLVFYEQGRSTAVVALVDREIREVLEKQTTYHIDLYVEYMETNLFVDPAAQQKIREWYLEKYRDHQPDVIIAGDVLKILAEKPRNISIARGANLQLFDWKALERWRFKERDLPAGSVVLNRPPTLWEAYGPCVSVAMVLLLAETMLILELLRQRKKERIIRGHLRGSEARLREAQSIAQCGSWVWDILRNKTYWSDEMYRILGLVPQSVPPTSRLIHPGDDQY